MFNSATNTGKRLRVIAGVQPQQPWDRFTFRPETSEQMFGFIDIGCQDVGKCLIKRGTSDVFLYRRTRQVLRKQQILGVAKFGKKYMLFYVEHIKLYSHTGHTLYSFDADIAKLHCCNVRASLHFNYSY